MSHWKYESEPEDGCDPDVESAAETRKWLRREADSTRSRFNRELLGHLQAIERMASPFFLGLDYNEDLDDVDDVGPF